MKKKGYIFDLGDVLIRGIEKKYWVADLVPFFTGQMNEETFWKRYKKQHKEASSIADLKREIREGFQEITGVRESIKILRQQGHTLFLLSNHAREWIEYCEQQHQYEFLFDHTFYSYKTRILKPDIRNFQTISGYGFSFEDLVYIDDREKNIDHAKTVGITSILFTNAILLQKDLI